MALRAWMAAVIVTAFASAGLAQQNPLVGAWEEVAGRDAQGNPRQARPSMVVFSADGFFMFSSVPAVRPRLDKPVDQMTRDELVARFNGLQVRRGTYTVSGTTFTRIERGHDNPNLEGREVTTPFRFDGDVLVLLNVDPKNKSETRFRRARRP